MVEIFFRAARKSVFPLTSDGYRIIKPLYPFLYPFKSKSVFMIIWVQVAQFAAPTLGIIKFHVIYQHVFQLLLIQKTPLSLNTENFHCGRTVSWSRGLEIAIDSDNRTAPIKPQNFCVHNCSNLQSAISCDIVAANRLPEVFLPKETAGGKVNP